MKDDDQKIMWEAYEQSLNENDLDDDKAHDRAGLAPFSNTDEAEGWSAEETIDWLGPEVMEFAVDFLGSDLSHPKVTSFEDIDDFMREETISWVVNELQKTDNLPKRLDYTEHEDELNHLKNAIEMYLAKHFKELVDLAGEKGHTHDPSDVGHRGYAQEPPAVNPASPRAREVARRASLGSAYRPDEENLDFQARDRD
mgnify:CR=1 FL=1